MVQLEQHVQSLLEQDSGLSFGEFCHHLQWQHDADCHRLTGRIDGAVSSIIPMLQHALEAHLAPLTDRSVSVTLQPGVRPHLVQPGKAALHQVSNIIAVASGKGGVGKSTSTINLALALHAEGARVGILDADVFGPSLPMMLGTEGQRPEILPGNGFMPVEQYGIQTMSMGYLTTRQTPVVWRGPKASGAVLQMMQQTRWGNLDYLLVDLPPGTGDIQLTLAQKVPVSGALVVTTPQDIALLDAVKAIEMFGKVDIHVLGIVENMAMHVCSNCGHTESIFGEGGGQRLAEQYAVPMLGQLPLSLAIRQHADHGEPIVRALPDSPESSLYRALARKVSLHLGARPLASKAFPPVQQVRPNH